MKLENGDQMNHFKICSIPIFIYCIKVEGILRALCPFVLPYNISLLHPEKGYYFIFLNFIQIYGTFTHVDGYLIFPATNTNISDIRIWQITAADIYVKVALVISSSKKMKFMKCMLLTTNILVVCITNSYVKIRNQLLCDVWQ